MSSKMNCIFSYKNIDQLISISKYRRAILDANFLIKLFHNSLSGHQECFQIYEKLKSQEFTFVANVTAKSELLDFCRRSHLTKLFYEAEDSGLKFTKDTYTRIKEIRQDKQRAKEKQNKDDILNNSEIESIRNTIMLDSEVKLVRNSITQRQGISGAVKWSIICDTYLNGKLTTDMKSLNVKGISYLSYEQLKTKNLVADGKILDWPEAIMIAESTGIGFWDAMFINYAEIALVDFILTLDTDICYAYYGAKAELLTKMVLTSDKAYENIIKIKL